MKILIADDSQTHRYWLQETLIELGHEVTTACDGKEAWEILSQKDAPQLVILDWIMPEMNGVEVCRKFRETYGLKPTYIVLLTGKKKGTKRQKIYSTVLGILCLHLGFDCSSRFFQLTFFIAVF